MKNRSCQYCLNDYTVKRIKIDENGKCNYCKTYDEYYDVLHNYVELKKLFLTENICFEIKLQDAVYNLFTKKTPFIITLCQNLL